ncbi:hypothetical protein [uncultured Brachyspira sp.]|uniref:hypothetical protein n=1 Tax=uncultured Brachyspira sp. TaxID=221953 RepID=UPI00261FF7AE|nr:hypothetical protein [uncultured Brachyspira sp.]
MPVAKKLSNYSKFDIIRGFECGFNKQDKEMRDKIVNLADNIIKLNKKLAVEKNPNAVNMINRQIKAVDKQV